MGYIYKITNQVNQKIYIGKTISSISTRFSQHLWESFNPKCNGYNFILHKAIRKCCDGKLKHYKGCLWQNITMEEYNENINRL